MLHTMYMKHEDDKVTQVTINNLLQNLYIEKNSLCQIFCQEPCIFKDINPVC